jgi:hypothetical protein
LTKEENQIKQVLCSTLLDAAFNWIKNAWDTLKRVYAMKSANVIRFLDKRCEKNESVWSDFERIVSDEDYMTHFSPRPNFLRLHREQPSG